jgi:hypothetical protein
MFPLLDDCGGLLNKLYDATDGTEDGQASVFAKVYSDCLNIPTEQVLSDLKYLQAQGQCPDVVLDGVAATEVGAAACRDTWMNSAGCDVAIASGILSCSMNFCSTTPTLQAPCDLAGHCDKTCGFCARDPAGESDGDHRHRRSQEFVSDFMHQASCVTSLEVEAARINDACCDTGTESSVCASGMPTECDVKCAVVFSDFYGRCGRSAERPPTAVLGYYT